MRPGEALASARSYAVPDKFVRYGQSPHSLNTSWDSRSLVRGAQTQDIGNIVTLFEESIGFLFGEAHP